MGGRIDDMVLSEKIKHQHFWATAYVLKIVKFPNWIKKFFNLNREGPYGL